MQRRPLGRSRAKVSPLAIVAPDVTLDPAADGWVPPALHPAADGWVPPALHPAARRR